MDLNATYRIVLIAKSDAFYNAKKDCIGKDIQIVQILREPRGNWLACTFKWLDTGKINCFYKVLLKKLNQHVQLKDKTYMKPLNGTIQKEVKDA